MAVRTDEVQLRIDFITDESRALARTLNETKQYNSAIAEAEAKVRKYNSELAKANITDAKRAELLGKVAAQEKVVADNLLKIAAAGKQVEKLDLGRVTRGQLVERAKQLEQAISRIPQSAPEFKALQTELGAVNKRLGEIRNTSKGLGETTGKGGGFGGLIGLASRAGALIGTAAVAFKGLFTAIGNNAKLEQTNIAFETFLGNASAAKRLVADLQAFEVKTPFEAPQVFDAAKAFLAFGFSQKEIIPTLEKVGTVAAATGKDFNELALIYGKARAEGIIQNDTLNQLAEAGVPIYAELAKVLGVQESQIRKLAETGKIGFKDLERAFGNLTAEGGRFNGLLERQSESLNGLFSTLSGAFKARLTEVFAPLAGLIKEATKAAIDFLSTPVSDKLEQERQAFNGLSLQILNANVGTKERTTLINNLKAQYPEYLKDIDAEKATNEQLQPILDRINKSYVIRIALQRQQEKILPLLQKEADAATLQAETRAKFNQQLARGAELAGVSLQAFQTEAEQRAAVIAGLQQKVQGKSFFLSAPEEARILNLLQGQELLLSQRAESQQRAAQNVTAAEKERLAVVEELKKTYGDLVDQVTAPVVSGGGGTNTKAAEDAVRAAAEAAAKVREKAFDEALKQAELQQKKQELLLELARTKGEVDENTYQARLSQVLEAGLNARLAVYERYGKQQLNDAQELRNQLAAIEAGRAQRQGFGNFGPLPTGAPGAVQQGDGARVDSALAVAGSTNETLQAGLKSKFQAALISEGEYNVAALELKRQLVIEELNILRSATQPQLEEIQKREEDRKKIEEQLQKERIELAKREEEAKKGFRDQSVQALQDAFGLAAEIYAEDVARRKKNASIIKAFESGQVITAGLNEVQQIYANAQTSPVAKAYGPIAGNILAGIQAGIATARTAFAVSKIKAQQFAEGGYTGNGSGAPDSTGFKVAGVVHEGEYVVPKWQIRQPEVQQTLGWLEARRQRGYAQGGLVTSNTTPTLPLSVVAPGGTGGGDQGASLAAAANALAAAVATFPRELKARVAYTEIEDTKTELDSVRNRAAI